jgi:DNA-binding MarR family transcriptional regulator
MTHLSDRNNRKFELEDERQEPRNIALALFRFKARRGIGVYYTLLATVPILVALFDTYSAPSYLTLISVGLLILSILFLARWAGMKRFYQMRLVMAFFEQQNEGEKQRLKLRGVLGSARTVLITLLPLIAAAVFVSTGSAILASGVLIGLVSYMIAYYIFVFSRQLADAVLPWQVEDWLIVALPTTLLLLSFFRVIGTTPYLVSLLLLLLLAGLKSSYDAPQALVQVLNDKNSFSRSLSSSKNEDVNISELASGGTLSSSARVGIMLALLGVGQITFTDLLFVVKVSKSTLNHSVNVLADAGYVTVRKGFKTAGGPRTFIQITNQGKSAIRIHLENMQKLASKFLS